MMVNNNRKAYTLVEILIAAGVSAIFLGMALTLFLNFSKNFSAGEGSAVLMQECALFTARLRNDLNNAVKPKGSESFITIDETQLMFNIYDNNEGRVKPVIYSAVPLENGYYNMTRRMANEASHTIVKGKVASYSWRLNEEIIPTEASPVKRLGLEIHLKMGTEELKNKSFDYHTTIYPVRVNK